MSDFIAILYGFVQGVAEYLPISSSAHLILLPRFLQIDEPGLAFDVFLHGGTLLATLLYFRHDWAQITLSAVHWLRKDSTAHNEKESHRRQLLINIVIGTIPALIIGALFHNVIRDQLRGNEIIAFSLPLGGLLLGLSDITKVRHELVHLKTRGALWIGLTQCLALIPGMSRSGSTLFGGRALGLSRTDAARFSFLLSGPITAAAFLFELRSLLTLGEALDWRPYFIGAGFAFIAGIGTIHFLLKMLPKIPLVAFFMYRLLLGIYVYSTLIL